MLLFISVRAAVLLWLPPLSDPSRPSTPLQCSDIFSRFLRPCHLSSCVPSSLTERTLVWKSGLCFEWFSWGGGGAAILLQRYA